MARRLSGEETRGALVLVGFMGAGKSSSARDLGAALDVRPLDSDLMLEQQLGHSIAEEFQRSGEQGFRVQEERLVCELLERAGPGDVVALGGGSVLSPRVRAALTEHLVVYLDVDLDAAWERASGRNRPLATDRDEFARRFAERRGVYLGVADAVIVHTSRGAAVRALSDLDRLRHTPAGTRLLWATSDSGEYPVLIGRGTLGAGVWPGAGGRRRFCVTDSAVRDLYAESLGEVAGVLAITPGEEHKTLESARGVWSALVAGGITRADELVALGGGVVGDLTGFCAATYQRGMAVVHVPTTVVAQVDSAYGGKTGVDLPEAKNYVGSYHQPAGVLVDPGTLATLPRAECAAGWVEVLKTALIAGGELWNRVTAGDPLDEEIIFACAHTKLAIVAEDERDAGRRQVLNLGHTVGHAIETATGYRRYRHGEAVGLGLLAALRLSSRPELREQVHGLLKDQGLPTRIQGTDAESIVEAVRRDKKRTGDRVPFVLVDGPGAVSPGVDVADDELSAAVAELTAPPTEG
ncbi:MAG TPA: bifunctional shikimate kinase/3-dehydroquinate synthase [Solirubrobacteraceae bacterium]|nr:bifunctional shikimate kinase/3-dehydroquinate synthase [Solirubrobacteraceae bacterium]